MSWPHNPLIARPGSPTAFDNQQLTTLEIRAKTERSGRPGGQSDLALFFSPLFQEFLARKRAGETHLHQILVFLDVERFVWVVPPFYCDRVRL